MAALRDCNKSISYFINHLILNFILVSIFSLQASAESFIPTGLPNDAPDPHVIRIGQNYYLTFTVGNSGNLPLYTSTDLKTWSLVFNGFTNGLLAGQPHPNGGLIVNNKHYCNIWAPEIFKVAEANYQLSFTATPADSNDNCTSPFQNTSTYFASSTNVSGPYALNKVWEPLLIGPNQSNCPNPAIAHSTGSLIPQYGINFIIDDHSVSRDLTDQFWMSYSYYSDPMTAKIAITQLDNTDPYVVACSSANPANQWTAIDSRSQKLLGSLKTSCKYSIQQSKCEANLSLSGSRTATTSNYTVAEGASIFQANGYYYLLGSGSAWDSGQYNVFWLAAKSIRSLNESAALMGRFIIPSKTAAPQIAGQHAFGHGVPIQDPNGNWFYLHHHMLQDDCKNSGHCSRNIWLTRIEFEDHKDGKGPIYIKPVFPLRSSEVNTSYQEAFGRVPNTNEVLYWVNYSYGEYSDLLNFHRRYLSQSAGATERNETIRRSYLKVFWRYPNDAELGVWLRAPVYLYAELVKFHNDWLAQRPEVFDAAWYLQHYPDLLKIYGPNNFSAAAQHWLNAGITEGRQGSANFWSVLYFNRYPELAAEFGTTNYHLAINHYMVKGIPEGRTGK